MLKHISRARLVGAWLAAVVVAFACTVVVGGPAMTFSAGELWLVVCLVPPAVMLLVWPAAPAVTVAEVLYTVNKGK
jgi:hypothetical protein